MSFPYWKRHDCVIPFMEALSRWFGESSVCLVRAWAFEGYLHRCQQFVVGAFFGMVWWRHSLADLRHL
jgi:hypothetical protein